MFIRYNDKTINLAKVLYWEKIGRGVRFNFPNDKLGISFDSEEQCQDFCDGIDTFLPSKIIGKRSD